MNYGLRVAPQKESGRLREEHEGDRGTTSMGEQRGPGEGNATEARALETFQKELMDNSVKCLRTIQKGKEGKCAWGLAVRGSLRYSGPGLREGTPLTQGRFFFFSSPEVSPSQSGCFKSPWLVRGLFPSLPFHWGGSPWRRIPACLGFRLLSWSWRW